MKQPFQLGLTRDFLTPEGKLTYKDIGLSVLESHPNIQHRFLDKHEPVVQASQIKDFDAIISLTPAWKPETLKGAERFLSVVRFGVGYDGVDVPSCTEADVLLCITAGAVNHPVAEATVMWMLALSHKVRIKDRLTREGRWAERSNHMGTELRDHTLGVVGVGGIGGKLVELLRGFGMKQPLAFDPFLTPQRATELGVKLVPLDQLLKDSDFISVNCPLTDKTRNLIGRDQLALMKPTSYLINTARGGIVNEAALIEVLKARAIAGAATDVYETEPVKAGHPFAELDNVILAPHSIAWTDELFRDIGRMACHIATRLAVGEVPPGVINKEVLERKGFKEKLAKFRN